MTVMIRRQVLEVDLHGTEQEGLALERRLPRMCADALGPEIEKALAPVDPGDGHLYVDRLLIDVTVASIDELPHAVHRELQDHFRRHPPARATPPGADPVPVEEITAIHLTFGQKADQALDTFLRTGRLPWSFRLAPGRTLEEAMHDAWGQPDPPPAARQNLRAALTLAEARERLALQFTAGFLTAVLRALDPDVAEALARIETVVDEAGPATTAARAFIRLARVEAIRAAIEGRRPRPDLLVRSVRHSIDPADQMLVAALEREWPGSTSPAGTHATSPPRPRSPEDDTTGRHRTGVPQTESLTTKNTMIEDDGTEGILVDGAGVVLLHPFLPRFFETLGLTDGDDLTNPGRAVCLLHHLATGELTTPEHRVTLAKVLCGLPVHQPVEADAELTRAEIDEARALLEAVIRHWEALRSTTPDGLRAEFLQRPGILSRTPENDWLLRVEPRTVDILLDRLPWGLAAVHAPWMNHLMMVEWR